MLREQRLMFFEESGEDNSYKKYNKYKEQIEEIKRNFPEDKKKRNEKITFKIYVELDTFADDVMKEINQYIKMMETKNLSNSESRKIIKTIKKIIGKSFSLSVDSEYKVKEDISTILNSSLDKLLNRYKKEIENAKKKIETDTNRLDNILKNKPNTATKLTVNFIKPHLKKLYCMRIECVEKELTCLIHILNKMKKR